MLWILYLVNCLFLFHCFLVIFSWSFNWEWCPCLFILLNFLCLYEFRWNSCILWALKRCSYGGVSLCRLHVPRAFGERAGFNVDASHVFPQGILAAITLGGSVAGGGGARAYEGFEVGFSLCSVAGIILLGVGSDPYLQEQKPWGLCLSWFCSL